MSSTDAAGLSSLLRQHEDAILTEWLDQLSQGGVQSGRMSEQELRTQCRALLSAFADGVASGGLDATRSGFYGVRDLLSDIARTRALQGYSAGETALFVFSLKRPLASRITQAGGPGAAEDVLAVSMLLDQLGLHVMEVYQKSREEVIIRQQQEIAELSTPVVQLWTGVLALPLIGTLDSARTQVVMENLLQSIVDAEAEIAIIDITGVPTVDTLVAQHLLKTVAAARLMGADCIISGIRPQIAQTMVHLGVELNVVTKATLADAFKLALQRTGRTVTKVVAGGPARTSQQG
ncbi:MAG TPA: STAS domain-containing protein [Azospirillaceae bacterium]|nr:STAS domain-containing protein [Azospirillaceae bacterium]